MKGVFAARRAYVPIAEGHPGSIRNSFFGQRTFAS
jgi:hypothetical protein